MCVVTDCVNMDRYRLSNRLTRGSVGVVQADIDDQARLQSVICANCNRYLIVTVTICVRVYVYLCGYWIPKARRIVYNKQEAER